jgi:Uma2 family endonuclease
MALARKGATLEEFLELPEEEPALEYFDGEVRQKVSPSSPHAALTYKLCECINAFALPRQLARAFPELRATFAGESPVPDVVVFRWDRIPAKPSGRLDPRVRIPPDIAVEIVSPGQSVNWLVRRCRWYVGNGVEIALLVDPDDESVLLFRHDGAIEALRGPDQIDINAIVPGLDLTANELFTALQAR